MLTAMTRRTDDRHFGPPEQVSPGRADGVKQRFLALPGASAVKRRRGEARAANSEQRAPGAGPKAADRTGNGQAWLAARSVVVALREALREQNRAGIGRAGTERQGGARVREIIPHFGHWTNYRWLRSSGQECRWAGLQARSRGLRELWV